MGGYSDTVGSNIGQGSARVFSWNGTTWIEGVPAAATLAIAIAATSATNLEGNTGSTAFTFTVTRNGSLMQTSTVNWAVTGSGTNQATAVDFAGNALPTGSLTFTAGETSKTITVQVAGDSSVEPDESFTVTLSTPSAGSEITTATAQGVRAGAHAGRVLLQPTRSERLFDVWSASFSQLSVLEHVAEAHTVGATPRFLMCGVAPRCSGYIGQANPTGCSSTAPAPPPSAPAQLTTAAWEWRQPGRR